MRYEVAVSEAFQMVDGGRRSEKGASSHVQNTFQEKYNRDTFTSFSTHPIDSKEKSYFFPKVSVLKMQNGNVKH